MDAAGTRTTSLAAESGDSAHFGLSTAARIAIPNVITMTGLAVGLWMVLCTGFRWDLVVLAMALDVADGAVARALQATTVFGAVLDSLADSVNFALAPALLVSGPPAILLGLFCVSGWARLVGFTLGYYQDHKTGEYLGFPTPLASIVLYTVWWSLKPFPEHTWAVSAAIVLLVVLEHVPLRIPKLGGRGSTTIHEAQIKVCTA
jgi:CDP-diacylglycerol--serine O-phosphatidyltransferase